MKFSSIIYFLSTHALYGTIIAILIKRGYFVEFITSKEYTLLQTKKVSLKCQIEVIEDLVMQHGADCGRRYVNAKGSVSIFL